MSKDTERLAEDVTMHTLGSYVTHDDGRGCGYHWRLGVWVTGNGTHEPPLRCLRDHAA